MKKILFTMVFIVAARTAVGVNSFWPGATMTREAAKSKWGAQSFDRDRFRNGGPAVRAAMASDLLAQEDRYVGKPLSEIKSALGDHDGHYFNDSIPAYLIQEGHKKGDESWQLVFLPDKNRKVAKIIIHKNCCD